VGGSRPKQFRPLGEMPLLANTLAVFQSSALIDEIVLIVPPGDEDVCRREIVDRYALSKVTRIVPGGASRQESVAGGLRAVAPDVSLVLIHDAARPFVTADLIRRVLEAAASSGAAIAAIPVVDTLKRRSSPSAGAVTIERDGVWAAQTPQAFHRSLLVQAFAQAAADGFTGTDDASLVERLGHPIALVDGHPANLKITTAEDLEFAEDLIAVRQATGSRSGTG